MDNLKSDVRACSGLLTSFFKDIEVLDSAVLHVLDTPNNIAAIILVYSGHSNG